MESLGAETRNAGALLELAGPARKPPKPEKPLGVGVVDAVTGAADMVGAAPKLPKGSEARLVTGEPPNPPKPL